MSKPATLTMTMICEGWGVSRPTAASRLVGIEFAKRGSSKHYQLRDVVKAFADPSKIDPSDMGTTDRKNLSQAEIQEEKLKRLRGESVNAIEVEALFCDIFKRLADAIKAWDWLPIKARRAICAQIRSEIERCNGDVAKCTFKVANPDA